MYKKRVNPTICGRWWWWWPNENETASVYYNMYAICFSFSNTRLFRDIIRSDASNHSGNCKLIFNQITLLFWKLCRKYYWCANWRRRRRCRRRRRRRRKKICRVWSCGVYQYVHVSGCWLPIIYCTHLTPPPSVRLHSFVGSFFRLVFEDRP